MVSLLCLDSDCPPLKYKSARDAALKKLCVNDTLVPDFFRSAERLHDARRVFIATHRRKYRRALERTMQRSFSRWVGAGGRP